MAIPEVAGFYPVRLVAGDWTVGQLWFETWLDRGAPPCVTTMCISQTIIGEDRIARRIAEWGDRIEMPDDPKARPDAP